MSITAGHDHVTLDLHGYTPSHAIYEVVTPVIHAAWRKGYSSITLIHGSPDIWEPPRGFGRGGIKWSLRRVLRQGEWKRWVWNMRSVKHHRLEKDSGAMTLALRPNPHPDPELPWPTIDEPPYKYEGPWHRRR
jgi:hypothetical protein